MPAPKLDDVAPRRDPPDVSLGFLLVTTFGLGYMRPASGTWGSLPPVALASGLAWVVLAFELPWSVYIAPLIAIAFASCAACVFMGDRAEARFGKKDASEIVADETAGQCIPLFAVPFVVGWGSVELIWPALALVWLSFFAFRAFDIWKPEPANSMQSIPGGWGVLLDDLVAGVYAAALVALAGVLVSG
ncbi:MAG: phosphatidylglycerophosphatase A [Planctomycetota bacterium]